MVITAELCRTRECTYLNLEELPTIWRAARTNDVGQIPEAGWDSTRVDREKSAWGHLQRVRIIPGHNAFPLTNMLVQVVSKTKGKQKVDQADLEEEMEAKNVIQRDADRNAVLPTVCLRLTYSSYSFKVMEAAMRIKESHRARQDAQ
eukprot:755320-Hanusia_phi.AAC.4